MQALLYYKSKEIKILNDTSQPPLEVYRKSSIRSTLCIILDPNFPRLVLEVVQNYGS